MTSPPPFRIFAHFLPFFNQETCVVCYTWFPPHLNGISCPIMHLPRFTPLGVSAFQDSSSLNEPWPRCTRLMPWVVSSRWEGVLGSYYRRFSITGSIQ